MSIEEKDQFKACTVIDEAAKLFGFSGNIKKQDTGERAAINVQLDMSGYSDTDLMRAGVISLQYKIKKQIWEQVTHADGAEVGACTAKFNVHEILNQERGPRDTRFNKNAMEMISMLHDALGGDTGALLDRLQNNVLYAETTLEELEAALG